VKRDCGDELGAEVDGVAEEATIPPVEAS